MGQQNDEFSSPDVPRDGSEDPRKRLTLSYTASMNKKKGAFSWLAILSFFANFALGGGCIWEWKKTATDAQREQVEQIAAARGFRKSEEEQLQKIISLANEFMAAEREYAAHPTPELHNRFLQLSSQLAMAKDNFRAIEVSLATLEHRNVRDINIEFVPPSPPTGLTAVVK